MLILICLCLVGCSVEIESNCVPEGTQDVRLADGTRAALDWIGNPMAQTYPRLEQLYARNPWDLQAYQGKLYIGGGNSSNLGPAQNAGPVPVISYDPETGGFSEEAWVDDEQVDRFRILDGTLYIPGHDPRESWDWGNYYVRSASGWKKHRTLPQAIHAYDMAWQDGQMVAGLGIRGGSAIALSRAEDRSWDLRFTPGFRIYTFLQVKGNLYGSDVFPSERIRQWSRDFAGQPQEEWPWILQLTRQPASQTASVFELDAGHVTPRQDLTAGAIFPGQDLPPDRWAKIFRSLRWEDRAVYLGAYIHNDHQAIPFGVFIAESLDQDDLRVQRVTLPLETRPWDILIHKQKLYILTDSPGNGPGRLIQVWQSGNLEQFDLVLSFEAPSFARSFEILDGHLYFGLGGEWRDPDVADPSTDDLPSCIGWILGTTLPVAES